MLFWLILMLWVFFFVWIYPLGNDNFLLIMTFNFDIGQQAIQLKYQFISNAPIPKQLWMNIKNFTLVRLLLSKPFSLMSLVCLDILLNPK